MTETIYTTVGKISKPHGIHGALIFVFDIPLIDEDNFPLHYYILQNGLHTPFFTKEVDIRNAQSAFISLENITNRSQAELLLNKELFLKNADAEKYFAEEEDELAGLIGYEAFSDGESIGIITAIEEREPQPLFVVEKNEKTHLIPAVDDFVLDIDDEKQQLFFDLPLGLLEL